MRVAVQQFADFSSKGREECLPGLIMVCFGWFWVRGLPFPNARHLVHPFTGRTRFHGT